MCLRDSAGPAEAQHELKKVKTEQEEPSEMELMRKAHQELERVLKKLLAKYQQKQLEIFDTLGLMDGDRPSPTLIIDRLAPLKPFERTNTLRVIQQIMDGELEGRFEWTAEGLVEAKESEEAEPARPIDMLCDEYQPEEPMLDGAGHVLWEPINVGMIDKALRLNAMRQARTSAAQPSSSCHGNLCRAKAVVKLSRWPCFAVSPVFYSQIASNRLSRNCPLYPSDAADDINRSPYTERVYHSTHK